MSHPERGAIISRRACRHQPEADPPPAEAGSAATARGAPLRISMDYRQAIDYLSGFTNWERTAAQAFAAANFDLRRVHSLLARLGNPHLGRRTVHIAGSKGKGSIAAMTAAVLSAATRWGRRPLHQPSPAHLLRTHRRGRPAHRPGRLRPPDGGDGAAAAAENADGRFGQLTTFELLTALAFLYFREQGAGWQVLEVGMGGRLDATSVVGGEGCGRHRAHQPGAHRHPGRDGGADRGREGGHHPTGRPVVMAPQPFRPAAAVIRRQATEAGAPLVDVAELLLMGAAGRGTYRARACAWTDPAGSVSCGCRCWALTSWRTPPRPSPLSMSWWSAARTCRSRR